MAMAEYWQRVVLLQVHRISLRRDTVTTVEHQQRKVIGSEERKRFVYDQIRSFRFPPVLACLLVSLDKGAVCSESLQGHSMSMTSSSVERPLSVTLKDVKASSGAAC